MTNSTKHPVTEVLEVHIQRYLDDLGEIPPSNIYPMVLTFIEKPVLEIVMKHANQNQSLAAKYLGLNRNTLHKKLVEHGLLSN
jgi:Fis family transcriptional regulator